MKLWLLNVCGYPDHVLPQVCNAYTELNDPAVQRARFEQQAKDKVNPSSPHPAQNDLPRKEYFVVHCMEDDLCLGHPI